MTKLPAPACLLAGAIPRQPSQARTDCQLMGGGRPLGQIVADLTNEIDERPTGASIRRFQDGGHNAKTPPKFHVLMAALLVLLPTAAQAECLGDGCYDGIVWFLGGFAAVALALIITLIVLLVKRKFKAALIFVAVCFVTFYFFASLL